MAETKNQLPGVMTRTEAELREIFLTQVEDIPAGERIKRCIQCGTCTGSCPVSYAMDISPRQLIALFRAGEMETVMKSRTIWICASCYACTTRCPEGIKITDMIYALKRTAMEKDLETAAPQVQVLAKLFISNLMAYGRLHEGTLIGMYYAKTGIWKALNLIPLGRKMLKTKRLALFPKKIKARESLSKIIKKAQEIEVQHVKESVSYTKGYVGYKALDDLKLEQRKGD